MDKKPVILVLLPHYLPGYKCGGPIRSIANLVDHLDEEFDFKIITSDRDWLETEPFREVRIDEWNTAWKFSVFYGSPEQLSLLNLARLISSTSHDLLYINSFFSPRFSIFPLLARKLGITPKRPVVLAPRGEFSKGALALKTWKKRVFILAAKLIGLHRDLTWQASSEYEAEDIRSSMGGISQQIIVAPNLLPKATTSPDNPAIVTSKNGDALKVVFLSRISPKKNLDYAIDTLKRISGSVEFDIYGVVDDQIYWENCKTQMASLPKNVKATYQGTLDHSKVHAVLASYDLFFFPTWGENFGHVIFEALAAGIPALISDQTPWRDLEEKGVGWVRPLNKVEGFVRVISELARMGESERFAQRARARKYASDQADNHGVRQANYELFKKALL